MNGHRPARGRGTEPGLQAVRTLSLSPAGSVLPPDSSSAAPEIRPGPAPKKKRPGGVCPARPSGGGGGSNTRNARYATRHGGRNRADAPSIPQGGAKWKKKMLEWGEVGCYKTIQRRPPRTKNGPGGFIQASAGAPIASANATGTANDATRAGSGRTEGQGADCRAKRRVRSFPFRGVAEAEGASGKRRLRKRPGGVA